MTIKTQDMRGTKTSFERYEIDANNCAIDFGEIINFYFQGEIFHWNKIDNIYYKYGDPKSINPYTEFDHYTGSYNQSICKIELTSEQEAKVKTIKMLMVLDK